MNGEERRHLEQLQRRYPLPGTDDPHPGVDFKAVDRRHLDEHPQPAKVTNASSKPRMDLIPWDAVEAIAEHFGTSAAKYPDRDWEEHIPEYQWSVYIAAAFRHLARFAQGEDRDEKGYLHATAFATNALMLLAYVLRGHPGDNRPHTNRKDNES